MISFERVAEAGGRLLKVELARTASQGLVLTFDLGRLWVRPAAGGRGLLVVALDSASAVPGGLEDACEEEPWWRVLGNELAQVRELEDAGGVRLQFRRDEDNPRVVRLASGPSAGLDVRLEATLH